MEIFGISLLTILLVIGLVLLLTHLFMTLGTAALGVIALIGIIGAIFFGVGFIEVVFGGVEGLASFIWGLIEEGFGLEIVTGDIHILSLFWL
ncbi:MAG: hypothetical protein KGY66_04725 [Candidatus Thermoplasmatota archaeon]|nr:hypothetical protein [Candidatus Thermoplasmatota archaeon]MBS3790201.1 hypothetical protein [Candidatus Thermoplasmatota archaeon]